ARPARRSGDRSRDAAARRSPGGPVSVVAVEDQPAFELHVEDGRAVGAVGPAARAAVLPRPQAARPRRPRAAAAVGRRTVAFRAATSLERALERRTTGRPRTIAARVLVAAAKSFERTAERDDRTDEAAPAGRQTMEPRRTLVPQRRDDPERHDRA